MIRARSTDAIDRCRSLRAWRDYCTGAWPSPLEVVPGASFVRSPRATSPAGGECGTSALGLRSPSTSGRVRFNASSIISTCSLLCRLSFSSSSRRVESGSGFDDCTVMRSLLRSRVSREGGAGVDRRIPSVPQRRPMSRAACERRHASRCCEGRSARCRARTRAQPSSFFFGAFAGGSLRSRPKMSRRGSVENTRLNTSTCPSSRVSDKRFEMTAT